MSFFFFYLCFVCVWLCLYTFVSTVSKPQDHSLRCSWRSKRIGHEQVTWCLLHRRLPAEEGRADLHPGGTARRGRMPQCKSFSTHCSSVSQYCPAVNRCSVSYEILQSTVCHKRWKQDLLWNSCKRFSDWTLWIKSQTYFSFINPYINATVVYNRLCVCFLKMMPM